MSQELEVRPFQEGAGAKSRDPVKKGTGSPNLVYILIGARSSAPYEIQTYI